MPRILRRGFNYWREVIGRTSDCHICFSWNIVDALQLLELVNQIIPQRPYHIARELPLISEMCDIIKELLLPEFLPEIPRTALCDNLRVKSLDDNGPCSSCTSRQGCIICHVVAT